MITINKLTSVLVSSSILNGISLPETENVSFYLTNKSFSLKQFDCLRVHYRNMQMSKNARTLNDIRCKYNRERIDLGAW